jgi:hypothetical protein
MPEEIHELDLVRDDVSLIYRPVKKLVLSNGDEYACVKFAIEKRKTLGAAFEKDASLFADGDSTLRESCLRSAHQRT